MSQEILQKIEALSSDVKDLKLGQDALRRDVASRLREVRAGQDSLKLELLSALGQSNEATLAAIQALHGSLKDTREKLRSVQ